MIDMDEFVVDYLPTEWVEESIVRWFVGFCVEYFGAQNVLSIFLFGSRARGKDRDGPPPGKASDHDFYVVLVEGAVAPASYKSDLDTARRRAGLDEIDILASNSLAFNESAETEGSFASEVIRPKNTRVLSRLPPPRR